MTSTAKQQLDELGFVALTGLIPPDLLAELRDSVERLWAAEGEDAGAEFKLEPGARRLANLVNKGEVFARLIVHPEVLDAMAYVLGPRFKLSSLNARSANPRSACRQPLHADAGAVADAAGYWVANSVWMLDDFTSENGAIRIVPGSHRWRRLPDPDTYDPQPDEQLITARAGTVVVMNAHAWHGATDNRTDAPRRAVHAFYTCADKPQQQTLSVRIGETLRRRLERTRQLASKTGDNVSTSEIAKQLLDHSNNRPAFTRGFVFAETSPVQTDAHVRRGEAHQRRRLLVEPHST